MKHLMSYIYKTLSLLPVILMGSYAFGEISIGGYFEPQLSFMDFKDSYRQLNSNKLRIDLQAQLSDNISFTGNFNYMNYNGHKEWNMLDFIPDRLALTIPVDSIYLYSFEYKDENKLDNAYLRMYSSIFTVTIGRQQISVGSGYAWNPTDLFNSKDILDPTYEQPGVDGLRLDAGISDDYMLTLFYLPEKTFTESGKLLRFTGRISHFDYALSVGRIWQSSINYPDFHKQEEKRDMLGFDINGELFGIGCWSENAYNYMNSSPDYWENVVGVDYTFSSGWYVMTEYFHAELGKRESEQYSFNDWMRFLTAEIKSLSRDQLYGYTFYPLTDLLNVGGSLIYSISDGSLLLIPTLEYSIGNDVTLTYFGNVFTGRAGTMNSNEMGLGSVLRLRAYF